MLKEHKCEESKKYEAELFKAESTDKNAPLFMGDGNWYVKQYHDCLVNVSYCPFCGVKLDG